MKKITLSSNENYGDPALKKAVGEIVQRIGKNLPEMQQPVSMYLAGGVAINFYTGYRSTKDIDASFSRLLLLPKQEELIVVYEAEEGKRKTIYLDTQYNTTFAVIHPDHEEDALTVEGTEFENRNICLKILSPVDLAVSKIARFVGKDKEDIEQLALLQLITAQEVEKRTKEALDYYVGNTTMLYLNLQDALDTINQVQFKKIESDKKQQLIKEIIKQQLPKTATQDQQVIEQANIKTGKYTGIVIETGQNYIVQQTGNCLTLHERSIIKENFAPGQDIRIAYRDGNVAATIQPTQENQQWAESIVIVANGIFQAAQQLNKVETPFRGIELVKGNSYQLQVNRNTETLTISSVEDNRTVASYDLTNLTVIAANPIQNDKQSWQKICQQSQVNRTNQHDIEL